MDDYTPPEAKNKPFDRAAHCRAIGSKGGRATVNKHGSSHMAAIGVKGFQATAKHFRSTQEYKTWLGVMGGRVYALSVGLPNSEEKFGPVPPAPWDADYTEF
jgi:hypothetical protein